MNILIYDDVPAEEGVFFHGHVGSVFLAKQGSEDDTGDGLGRV